jgi:hypothetical protein
MVGLMPTPVPKQEAEWHAERSLASVRTGWKLPSHRGHLIVAWQQSAKLLPLDGVKHYTWLLAAVADAAKALAVYWADSGATHPAEYFPRRGFGGWICRASSRLAVAQRASRQESVGTG